MNYNDFLQSKQMKSQDVGIDLPLGALNSMLFAFQADIVQWALRRGRAAILCECGLGKTAMQLEWAHQIHLNTGGNLLILTPLAVAEQTRREGEKFGIPVTVCKTQSDVRPGINVTNYERLHHFDRTAFIGGVLDESSILKNFMGKTKQALIQFFSEMRFRLACTATPAPNDHMELGNHCDFLGIMPANEMLMRWFINDSMHFGSYRLKGHAEKDFYQWMSTWAVFFSHPADLGYKADEFTLKPIHTHTHLVEPENETFENGQLFSSGIVSATQIHKEKRKSLTARVRKVADMVNKSSDTWIVWCDTNDEADALRKIIPDAVEVRGSDTPDKKEQRLNDFSQGAFRVLLTKTPIAGFGMNYQNCHNMAFAGVNYSFESYYQAVRRAWRFGQEEEVNIHVVMSETETEIYETVKKKSAEHIKMRESMIAQFQEGGFTLRGDRKLNTDIEEMTATGPNWTLHRGDSCEVMKSIPDDSIGFSVFSPPFANLYIYSDSIADMGNSADTEEFFAHFKFVIRELLRATMPGRIAAVHCKDLPRYAGRDGTAGLTDFPGEIIRAFEAEGWTFHSRVTIWKDPVIEMQRTKAHGLLYKNLRENSCVSRQGMADYVIAFRKWTPEMESLATNPVKHTHEEFPLDQWQQWASPVWNMSSQTGVNPEWVLPVWMDIQQTNVLNKEAARENGDEKHICPLQLDVIERCIALWSNPGDLVFSPFAGIGSEGFVALKTGRQFLGIELKESYFNMAVQNLRNAVAQSGQRTIFDYIGEETLEPDYTALESAEDREAVLR